MLGVIIIVFFYNDWEVLDKLLCDCCYCYKWVFIVIEGVYSIDGDILDLFKFIEIKKYYKVFLMVDEVYFIGIIGKYGCGISEYFGINFINIDLWMGILSKFFVSCGGYIVGSKVLVEYFKYIFLGFVYSVGIFLLDIVLVLAVIRLLKRELERVV